MKVLILSNNKIMPALRIVVDGMGVNATYNPDDTYDCGVSFMYLKRITKEQLEKPWINFHPAPLPKYRGRNLCYHAVVNGENVFGATVHYVDENFDTGRIIETKFFPILPSDTAGTVSRMAMLTSYELLEEYLPRFASGEVFETFENTGGTYYKKEPISDYVEVDEDTKRKIRAITYGNYRPKIRIGGVDYIVSRGEE